MDRASMFRWLIITVSLFSGLSCAELPTDGKKCKCSDQDKVVKQLTEHNEELKREADVYRGDLQQARANLEREEEVSEICRRTLDTINTVVHRESPIWSPVPPQHPGYYDILLETMVEVRWCSGGREGLCYEDPEADGRLEPVCYASEVQWGSRHDDY